MLVKIVECIIVAILLYVIWKLYWLRRPKEIRAKSGSPTDVFYLSVPHVPSVMCEPQEEPPADTWYTMRHWECQDILVRRVPYLKDWKIFESVPVAGLMHEGRCEKLFSMVNDQGFSIELVKDPTNKFDKNAIKVIAKSNKNKAHIGYIPRDTAERLTNMDEFLAVTHKLFLPNEYYYEPRMEIKVLVRSVRWKKKQNSDDI